MSCGATARKRLVVITSTFPRWKDDTVLPFVFELSRRLAAEFDVSVIAPHYPGAAKDETMDGVRVHRFRYFPGRFERLAGGVGILAALRTSRLYYFVIPFFLAAEYLSLRRAIKKFKPDVVHAHWIFPQGFISALAARRGGPEVVVTALGSDVFALRAGLINRLKRWTLRRASRITVVSNAMKREIEKLDAGLGVEVIPMGVDSKAFSPDKKDAAIRTRYGIDGPMLLFVGRLEENKGVQFIIDAMPAVVKRFPAAKLLVIGAGTRADALKEQAAATGVSGSVVFTGAIPNAQLPAYFASADVFVAPSFQSASGEKEGLPLTIAEAMASGCAVVASDLEGTHDLIADGETGFLVAPQNSSALEGRILAVLGDPARAAAVGRAAREKIRREFDWDVIGRKFITVIN